MVQVNSKKRVHRPVVTFHVEKKGSWNRLEEGFVLRNKLKTGSVGSLKVPITPPQITLKITVFTRRFIIVPEEKEEETRQDEGPFTSIVALHDHSRLFSGMDTCTLPPVSLRKALRLSLSSSVSVEATSSAFLGKRL